jgi:RING-type zinc-finger/IBR domain, a half RING-finger domain
MTHLSKVVRQQSFLHVAILQCLCLIPRDGVPTNCDRSCPRLTRFTWSTFDGETMHCPMQTRASMAATEDWQATCTIYEDQKSSTILDKEGTLVRGTIDLGVSLREVVCCRNLTKDSEEPYYRFWTLDLDELVFRLSFWCDPATGDYQRTGIVLLTEYPMSFSTSLRDDWLKHLGKSANELLIEYQVSFSICDFVQHQAIDFFPSLYQDENVRLIEFLDHGPTFYDTITMIAKPRQPFPFERHMPNGIKEIAYEMTKDEGNRIHLALRQWPKWLPLVCPICFETYSGSDLATVTCGHLFCRPCITNYLCMKAEEVQQHKENPFVCPVTDCRRGMLIIGCVKPFLPIESMEKVRIWYKDKKNPPCWSLPDCIKVGCGGRLRKLAIDSYVIFCDRCNGHWCELCLKRVRTGEHDDSVCDVQACVNFCQRYMAANDAAKQQCEDRWPWIKIYAHSRVHEAAAEQWIQNNGQLCPGCKTGVERTEGCFHMKCQCGTHFCYECGAFIHPPYYGTHHCWERNS